MQPKLLRAIEDKEFERVGGTKIVRSDFRVVAATNQHLESMLATGRFRKDLFYRLNVISLHIPPLRDRPSDILAISDHFLEQTAKEANLEGLSIDKEAERALRAYAWPGNVRELTNVLERSVSALEGKTIRTTDLPFYVPRGTRPTDPRQPTSLREMQARAEREAIWAALKEADFQKARAARILGIHRTLLYKKMRKYGLPLQPPP
jgi:transcriptional regulator with PAS, ATPase and Fis domain